MQSMPTICFDEEARVRVLPPEQFQQTQELEHECRAFLSKTHEFKTTVDSVMTEMGKAAKNIEKEKLKAIGHRNQLENENAECERQRMNLANLIREKQVTFDQYQAQYDSLLRAEASQMAMIEKLQRS
mmetsp:Transcript_34114/g.50099  ORF Transcript_34114/g.50099 Transcript_34114/m.50099 type:complete len:128 (+) Transcript_34114:4384-4767(+)